MSDTAVTTTNVVKLAKNTAAAAPAGQVVTTGNVAVLTPQAGQVLFTNSSSVGPQFDGKYMLVAMTESGSVSTSTATVKAGVTGGTPANLAVKGDLAAITFTSGQTKYLQIDLTQHMQANGTVRIAVGGASGSVTFTVLQLDATA